MLDDVSFDTTDDKLKWGGIFAAIGVTAGVSCVLLRCLCLRCCGRRRRGPIVKQLYVMKPKEGMGEELESQPPKWEPSYAAAEVSTNTDWSHRERVIYPNEMRVDVGTSTDELERPPSYGPIGK